MYDILLRCNLCVSELRNGASTRTDDLSLRTIGGRDYLVCAFHGEVRHAGPEHDGGGAVQALPAPIR